MDNGETLSAREKIILRAVVSHYIASGEAVGSRTLSKLKDCPWSSATIRNILAELADQGFLFQPHRSAGRLPSDKGFRFYVEEILLRNPARSDTLIPAHLYMKDAEVDKVIQHTPRMLAKLTHHVGVVLAPHFGHIRLKSINFIHLGEDRILSVLVARSGNILNKVITCEECFTREELITFSNYLTVEYSGMTLWQVRSKLHALIRTARSGDGSLLQGALVISDRLLSLMNSSREEIHVEGIPDDPVAQRILKEVNVSNTSRTKLMSILNRCIEDDRTHIFIGSEDPFTEENTCSLIATSYGKEREGHGVIGVIGKKTMAYERIIPLVEETAEVLNTKLSSSKEELHDG